MRENMNTRITEQFALWLTLHRISYEITKYEEQLYSKTHLTNTQRRLLLTMAFLIENNKTPLKITDLVPYHNSSLVTVSLTIDRMEKKGLVKKVRNLADRRAVRITITPKGERLLKESSEPTVKLINEIFSVFSDAELKKVAISMNKLLKIVEEQNISKKSSPNNKLSIEQTINFLNKLSTTVQK